MRWIVRGDIDGFFGLALDNLVQLLLIDTLCRFVLGFPPELVYGRVLPGAAVSILVGNLFYALPGPAAGRAHRPHRRLRAAVRHQHGVALRPRLPGHAAGEGARRGGRRRRSRRASRGRRGSSRRSARASSSWPRRFVAERVAQGDAARGAALDARRHRARLHLARLPLPHLRAPDRRPDDVRHRDADLLRPRAVQGTHSRRHGRRSALGTLLSWAIGIAPVGARPAPPALHLPVPVVGDLVAALGGGHLLPYLSVIVAMGLFNVLGSLQNIESAEAAGDAYETRPSLIDQRPRQRRRGALRLGVSDDDLHRPSRAGRRWARAPATRC